MIIKFHEYGILKRIASSFFFALLFSGCNDQSQKNICADPLGSQNITINSSNVNYNNCFFCFKARTTTVTDTCQYNNCFQFYFSSGSQTIRSIYFGNSCTYGTIADVGIVNCLGQVTDKPSSGFVYSVTPKVLHGYVVAFPDNTYGRFFIDSWDYQSGQVVSMNIVRQYPF
jgi:surface antigen